MINKIIKKRVDIEMPFAETGVSSKFSLIMLSEKNYLHHLNKVLSHFKDKEHKICYISLVRSHHEVIEELKREGVNINNFFFIDVVIGKGKKMPNTKNCHFVNNAKAKDIEKEIKKVIKKFKSHIILFDTVSALLMYEQKHDIVKFTHQILSNKSFEEINNVYIVIKDLGIKKEENKRLIGDLRMFANKELILD